MKTKTRKVTISLPPKLYSELETLAAQKGHRVPGYIRWLIWKHLEEMDIPVPLFPQGED